MLTRNIEPRLSDIQTQWTLVREACRGPEPGRAAQAELLERYGGAVRRYLGGVLRDTDAADDLFQEFAYRIVHGDLRGADPARGRFRHYVKGALLHLIADHHRRRQRLPASLPEGHPGRQVDPDSLSGTDQVFVACWRAELLAGAWATLADLEQKTGKLMYSVLRFRADHPDLSSSAMAEQLSEQLGKPFTAVGVRQTLHRARECFARHLLQEVEHSIAEPTPERLHEELVELGLLNYCRDALDRRTEKPC